MVIFGLKSATIEAIEGVLGIILKWEKLCCMAQEQKETSALTLIGEQLNLRTLQRIEDDIDDLLLPYKIDLSILRHIKNIELIDYIERVGQVFCEKKIVIL
jgi:uncharacterized protein